MALRRPQAIVATLAASAALIVGLSACGSDDTVAESVAATTAAATTATGTTTAVGGTASCDGESLVEAAQGSDPNVTGLDMPDAFQCSDGWAYASVSTADTAGDRYAEVMVFEAEGQFWISKDRAVVCKSPGDQVPASLYQGACETS